MNKAKVIEKLNQAIGIELCGLLQYNQYAQVLTGHERIVWQKFLLETSDEALAHARLFASKVVALGGVPCVEPEPVRQTTDIHEMLTNSLDLERRAVKAYTEALALCEDNPAYRNLLEDQIQQETDDCEELEKFLNKIEKVQSKSGSAKSKTG